MNGRSAELTARGIPGNLTLDEAVALTINSGAPAMIAHHHGLFEFNTLPLRNDRKEGPGARIACPAYTGNGRAWKSGSANPSPALGPMGCWRRCWNPGAQTFSRTARSKGCARSGRACASRKPRSPISCSPTRPDPGVQPRRSRQARRRESADRDPLLRRGRLLGLPGVQASAGAKLGARTVRHPLGDLGEDGLSAVADKIFEYTMTSLDWARRISTARLLEAGGRDLGGCDVDRVLRLRRVGAVVAMDAQQKFPLFDVPCRARGGLSPADHDGLDDAAGRCRSWRSPIPAAPGRSSRPWRSRRANGATVIGIVGRAKGRSARVCDVTPWSSRRWTTPMSIRRRRRASRRSC